MVEHKKSYEYCYQTLCIDLREVLEAEMFE